MYKGLLIDLDGTIVEKRVPIDGAFEAINLLLKKNIKIKIATNAVGMKIDVLAQALKKHGLNVESDHIINPIIICKYFFQKNKINSILYLGSTEIGEQLEVELNNRDNPQYIVFGDIESNLNYDDLNHVFNLIDKGTPALTTSKSTFYHDKNGKRIDTGSFVNMIESLTKANILNIGKPSNEFFRLAFNSLNLDKKDVASIGDDIKTDLLGAKNYGLNSIIVKTGKFDNVEYSKSNLKPDHLLDSLKDITKFYGEINE